MRLANDFLTSFAHSHKSSINYRQLIKAAVIVKYGDFYAPIK